MFIYPYINATLIISFILCSFNISLAAEEAPKTPIEAGFEIDSKEKPKNSKEELVKTSHTMMLNGENIPYEAIVGTQLLYDNNKNEPKASIFYIAYVKEGEKNKNRPITFCFNGGPGSSSVWLHLGMLGPKRVDMGNEGISAALPFRLVDNPESLLDITDLVFIDPVSTGYSRALPGQDAKQYHGVEADIQSVAEFIRLYITRAERWESPTFLIGESYGTTRAAGLAAELHDKHHIYLNGLILVSCVLNFQTLEFTAGNDLPYILFLPTYTATALYHNKLQPSLQEQPQKTLKDVEQFASEEYAQALMAGDHLGLEKRNALIEKLANYTGLTKEYIDKADLRVDIFRYTKELLKQDNKVVGRLDSRIKGIDIDKCSSEFSYDPSFEAVLGPFTATFNNYVRSELGWKSDLEYKTLANVSPWNYGKAINQYLDMGADLKTVMSKNVLMKVFVASGYEDLATPYFATDYTFAHLGIDASIRKNVSLNLYEGGHMMYLYLPTLSKMKKDIAGFMTEKMK